MKKILFVLPIVLLVSCNISSDPEPDAPYYDNLNCLPMPSDIPDTFASGTPVQWDCETQMFYNDGDLKLHYNDEGGLVAIQRIR